MSSQSQFWVLWLCFAIFASCSWARSVNNRQLMRIEPVTGIHLNIAPRPEVFYQKRQLTPNPGFQPFRPRSIEYDDMLRLAFTAYNQTFHLHLHPNTEIFHPEAVITIGGRQERVRPEDYRLYRGYAIDTFHTDARWLADRVGLLHDDTLDDNNGVLGWARIMVRHDIKHNYDYPLFEGTFQAHNDIYHIKIAHNYRLTKRDSDPDLTDDHDAPMVIYRDSDVTTIALNRRDHQEVGHCKFDDLLFNQETRQKRSQWGVLSENQLDINSFLPHGLTKRAPAGCPTARKVLYMGAAADCTYTKYYQSETNARSQILSDWSSASAVYESSFNIQLGLINITIMPETCPTTPTSPTTWNRECSTGYTIDNRLSDFSQWRGTLGNDGAGLWHLMTACASGVEIGVAWISTLCTQTVHTSSGGATSGTGVSSITRDEWKVVAHEIGHNFGAQHDCTADTCISGRPSSCCPLSSTECDAKGAYLMNPSSNSSSQNFSPCSIQQICTSVQSIGTCLQDPGTRTITTVQMCGNGIKESGEECDPGGIDNACCDAKTCKYKGNAKCDDSKDLCCLNCQVRNATYVCRPAASECDVPETCTGDSGDCPKDSYKPDGESCGKDLQCASGQCTSRNEQCKARAAEMGITRACGQDMSCQIICDNPTSLGCYVFNGFFVDGTPCGVGGSCKEGKCSMDNFGNNAKNWLENHKEIAIPVGIVLGLLLLFCIARCIFYGCCGYRAAQANKSGVYVVGSSAPPAYQANYYPYSTPPPGYPGDHRPSNWADPAAYNSVQPSTPPTAPPQSYTPAGRGVDAYEMDRPSSWRGQNASPRQENRSISERVRRFGERM